MAQQVIHLPELGEGIKEGTVISLLFKEGDPINLGDTVIEIETDKAVVGVPINVSGSLEKWYIKEGDTLKIGDKLLSITTETSESPIPEKNSPIKKATTSKDKDTSAAVKDKVSSLEVNFDGLGDGESGTVISLSVQEGDTVAKGDTLLELETDKAVVPFPTPESGVIARIWVKEGQEVKSGDKGFLLTTKAIEAVDASNTQAGTPPSTLTSPPTSTHQATRETESSPSPAAIDYTQADFSGVHAGPATRKLARELGVDLNQVKGSGRNGRISVEDVKGFAKSVISGSSPGYSTGLPSSKELPDFSQWGKIHREKTTKLRDTIAQSITHSWQAIPHVHQNDTINIDAILELQKKWKSSFENKGSSLSVTPFIVKALAQCLRDFPQFNSSYDLVTREIVFKEYFNIGVAVDTPQGLIVPVIKGVDQLSIFEIGTQLKNIAALTRERKVKPEDLRGACMTLSNLGGIGGSHFNPIINWPEVAILGVGRGKLEPVYDKSQGSFYPTMMLPACLAYDHRIIDGADGARFMVKLKQYLENPDLLLMGIQ